MFKPLTLFYADGYKVGHKAMLAPGTDYLYGQWIPRSTKHAPKGITKIVSFGQQLTWKWINDEFKENFFNVPLEESKTFAEDMSKYLILPYDGAHFEALHNLGYLPMHVKALPEGIETDSNIPHMTFINTVKGFAWLTLYLETIVSSLAWKPSTSATIAKRYRRNLTEWVMKTDPDNAWLIDYLAHDFSARGLNPWDMISSGLGHATSFRGSDTLICIPAARYFYGEPKNEVIINSVNASEHSVSTTKIFTVGEQQMLSDWMKIFPKGILSVVSDTFDLWQLITQYLPTLKDEIMDRDGKLVIRPDSGNPVDIICGYEFTDDLNKAYKNNILYKHSRLGTFHKIGVVKYDEFNDNTIGIVEDVPVTPQLKGVIQLLWEIFGGNVNSKGYKILDSHIGAIYGDSITIDRQVQIYERLEAKGFAATNIVLGVGSFTYQYNTRDTLGFAAKGGWFEENGISHNIYKDPVTDDGTKKSPKGLLRVNEVLTADGLGKLHHVKYELKDQCTPEEEKGGMLKTIFKDGEFYNVETFTQIRNRLKKF